MWFRRFHFQAVLYFLIVAANFSSVSGQNLVPSITDSTKIARLASNKPVDSTMVNSYGEYVPKWYDMVARIPGDWIEFSGQAFQAKNIPVIVGVAGLTTALVIVDRQWWWTEKKWYYESPSFQKFSDWMNLTFDGRIEIGVVGGFAAYGLVFGDTRAIRTASQATEAVLACGAVVQLLKYATGRESPYLSTTRTGKWDFFPNHVDYSKNVQKYDAFPSGHLSSALAVLIVISENYPELTWLKPAGYVVLAGVASSLVACGVHWWSDYPLAVVLGYSFGKIAANPVGVNLVEKKGTSVTPRLSLLPVVFPDGVGLGLSLSF